MKNYKCINCGYTSRLFNDMMRHLTRITQCVKNLEGYNYTDEEILRFSLLHYDIKNIDKIKIKDKNNKNNKIKITKKKYLELFNEIEKNKIKCCPLCNKEFQKKCDLKKHIIIDFITIDL